MGEKLVVGPIDRGLRNDRTAFVIDNDSFPTLINAYQWRGRIKRKRGTSLLGRLRRFIGTTDGAGNLVVTILPVPIATGIVSFVIGTDVFYDPGGASPVNLLTNSSGTGTLDRTTGVLTITGSQANTSVIYFPTLPVMGLEDLILGGNEFPGTLGFDTTYSYNIDTAFPYQIYDVSFYKNPPNGTYPGYIAKTTWTPTTWNGQNYQQFWTTNYQGALWATNGITVPFSITNIGMQFKPIIGVVIVPPPGNGTTTPAVANITILAHGLVQGDFVFINEVQGITGINFQTGYVTSPNPQAANVVTVTFPFAILGGVYTTGGIAQYLTNRSDTTKDSLRWYDGDPTGGNPPNPSSNLGWVNFAPPLSFASFSIANKPAAQYYLVGARMIVPFKDRLLFLGPVIQTSAAGSQIYLQDTVIYSQNGTPYYTASFNGNPSLSTTIFTAILVPSGQTAAPTAYWEDQTGFGGFQSAGIDQAINTTSTNEDALIIGFDRIQTRFIYTGNDIQPFSFFIINAELSSTSTFSTINMDKGVITRGSRGYIITSQVESTRIDLDIPNQVFEIKLSNNGTERFTAQRDFFNEWIYFTYNFNESAAIFPNQTLLYNYRDNSWGIFNESYTSYGQFRPATGFTWATIGTIYESWNAWNASWNSGSTTLLQSRVIAGNQQGFVIFRDESTDESVSISIQNIVGSNVVSPNHGLNNNDFIVISGVLGALGTQVNGNIFQITFVDGDNFLLNPAIAGGTYQGGGLVKRMYRPLIQTKQFPIAWEMARKTRIGPQRYLLTNTPKGQIQLLIFLSQNSTNAFNDSLIIPSFGSVNSGLVYSTVLFTSPESTNLGLTAPNTNLQMLVDVSTGISEQEQIWHRVNTSLIGDTVQLGFTMSDDQMRDINFNNQFEEIELHSFILEVSASQVLA